MKVESIGFFGELDVNHERKRVCLWLRDWETGVPFPGMGKTMGRPVSERKGKSLFRVCHIWDA